MGRLRWHGSALGASWKSAVAGMQKHLRANEYTDYGYEQGAYVQ